MKHSQIAVAVLFLSSGISAARAQTSTTAPALPTISIHGSTDTTIPSYDPASALFGPLGNLKILDTPVSVSVVPEDFIRNVQAKTVNDTLRSLPSVIIRNQQGYEVSRPQSRGFQSGIATNTRLDGLNIIGTTAVATENLAGIQVLNGLAGSLYGPETPAGVFDYMLKRPTDKPLFRYTQGYDSDSVFTENLDVGGRTGPDNKLGYRFNLVHGEGQSWAPESNANRTLLSADLDYHFSADTVAELDMSHYSTNITGLPGSIVYDGGKSTILPSAVDATKLGYGQPGAGATLTTNTVLAKIKHKINDDWRFEVGGLYQNAERGLYGITNTMTNNIGNYTTTKNFTAIPHFTISSNEAALNGHIDVAGFWNDVTIGTNGFVNNQYSSRNSIATTLGSATLANPVVYPTKALPATGGQYQSANLTEQSIITGDTFHFNNQFAIQGVLSTSFIHARSYSAAGKVTSADDQNGVLSPTVSLIYKPLPKITTYATFSSSVEEGEQAPAGTANANQFMSPYRDQQYEAGVKYAVSDSLLLTLDGFRITRPLANTSATTNEFSVVGTQKNYGIEMFVQGDVLPVLSLFGGLTYIDARLNGTGSAATNDKLVVGVPKLKGDLAFDFHPGFSSGVALTGAVHYESQRAATNTNNSFAPAYATFDLGMRYSARFFRHSEIFRFQVLNLTDKAYYTSVADGNIVGSPGANTAYLGQARTFMASLEFDY